MKQEDLLFVLKAFDTFGTRLQKIVEDRTYYTAGEYESFEEVLEESTAAPLYSLNEMLFRGLFPGSVELYMTSEVLSVIGDLPLEKGLIEGSSAILECKSLNGKKKKKIIPLPCRINDSGLNADDVYYILSTVETIISLMPKGVRCKTRDKVFQRMLCRFATQENAISQFSQRIQEESNISLGIEIIRVVLK